MTYLIQYFILNCLELLPVHLNCVIIQPQRSQSQMIVLVRLFQKLIDFMMDLFHRFIQHVFMNYACERPLVIILLQWLHSHHLVRHRHFTMQLSYLNDYLQLFIKQAVSHYYSQLTYYLITNYQVFLSFNVFLHLLSYQLHVTYLIVRLH